MRLIDAGISADAIDDEVVRIRPLPIDGELPLLVLTVAHRTRIDWVHAGHQIEETLKAPSIEGQVLYGLPFNNGANGGVIQVERFRATLDCNRLL